MRDGIILTVADDGTARVYYDTYDIVIHCESQEWRDKVKERIMGIKPKTTGSGFNHGEKDENWEARTTAEPSASDCWSNDNKTTNDSIVTKSSRYSTDRTTDDTISRQAAIDAINGLIDRFERILAGIRETSVDESVCGLCEYDGAFMGQSGDWFNECPGFDEDNCFKLSDSCRERWLNSVKLPSAQPERKKGKWIRTRTMTHDGELYCDQCEQEHPEQKIIWNFCPNCGCRMEEGDSE